MSLVKSRYRQRYNKDSEKRARVYAQRRAAWPVPVLRPQGPTYMLNQRMRRGPEFKFQDFNFVTGSTSGLAIAPYMNIWLLNGVDNGSDYNQRIGRKISVRSILINYIAYQYQSSVNTGHAMTYRVMIIRDRQPNGVVPVVGQIFQNTRS